MITRIKLLFRNVSWKRIRNASLDVLVGLICLYAVGGTTYGFYEAHENNVLQSQHHSEQVKVNHANHRADILLGQFAAYIIEVGLANCMDIQTIAGTFHIAVPGCPAIPTEFMPKKN